MILRNFFILSQSGLLYILFFISFYFICTHLFSLDYLQSTKIYKQNNSSSKHVILYRLIKRGLLALIFCSHLTIGARSKLTLQVHVIHRSMKSVILQCFDAVGLATGRAKVLLQKFRRVSFW